MIYEIVRHIEDVVKTYKDYHKGLGKTPQEIARGVQALKEEEIGILEQNDLQLDSNDISFIAMSINNIK